MKSALLVLVVGCSAAAPRPTCPPGAQCEYYDTTRLWKSSLGGDYREYGPDGALIIEGRFVDDQRDGVWREWWGPGRKRSECGWKRGQVDGPCIEWWENGRVAAELRYQASRVVEAVYYDEDGQRLPRDAGVE